MGRLPKLRVFGGDWKTKDGTGVRDFLHVTDLALGHTASIKKLLHEHVGCRVYNLGTGHGYSVLDMVKAMKKASGKEIPYEIVERRPGDVAEIYADVTLAFQELGWKATKTLGKKCRSNTGVFQYAHSLCFEMICALICGAGNLRILTDLQRCSFAVCVLLRP